MLLIAFLTCNLKATCNRRLETQQKTKGTQKTASVIDIRAVECHGSDTKGKLWKR